MTKIFFPVFRNIRTKVALFVFFLLILVTFIFYLVTLNIIKSHISQEVISRAESLTRSIASTAGYSFISQDLLGLDNIVFKIKNSNLDIEYIAIVDSQKKILVHSDVDKIGQQFLSSQGLLFKKTMDGIVIKEIPEAKGNFFELDSQIVFMDKKLGSVILAINKSILMAAQKDVQRKIMAVFAIILFIGITSSILLSIFLTKPIQELAVGVERLKKGKRSKPLKIYSRDELGKLTESFNEMTATLLAQRDKLTQYAQDLEESYISTVKVLAAAIEARDHYTLGHSTRVAQLSVLLGQELGLKKEELEELQIACLFHDVGKIKIPDDILLKKGKLRPPEWREMKRHPEYGAEILSKAPSLLKYIPAVRHHHEWYDGSGYPDGLKGEKIPLQAALISIADVYEAMTSDRPYRSAFSEKEVLKTMYELSGKQFNPRFIRSFLMLVRKKKPRQSSSLWKKQ